MIITIINSYDFNYNYNYNFRKKNWKNRKNEKTNVIIIITNIVIIRFQSFN